MTRRASLAQLMVLVALIAVGLAAMKVATEPMAWAAVVLAAVGLLVGILGSIVAPHRAGWIGFALFGWAHTLIALGIPVLAAVVPSIAGQLYEGWLIDRSVIEVVDWLHPEPPEPVEPPTGGAVIRYEGKYYRPEGGKSVELTLKPEEAGAIDAYLGQVKAQRDWYKVRYCSRQIGYVLQGALFALLGAAIGRALAGRSPSPTPA